MEVRGLTLVEELLDMVEWVGVHGDDDVVAVDRQSVTAMRTPDAVMDVSRWRSSPRSSSTTILRVVRWLIAQICMDMLGMQDAIHIL